MRVGVIGTVTLVEHQQVFAFGHPVFFSGPTQLPLTEAVVLATARGAAPAKVGDIGAVIGTVLQDRSAGIFARLGQPPPLAALRLCVHDRDRGRTEVLLADAVPTRPLLPLLASMAAREAMLRAMNRIGPGSASWEWSVTVDDRPDPVRRSDIAFDDTDIGAIVADSVVAFLEQLLDRGLIVRGVDLHAQVEMSPTASA